MKVALTIAGSDPGAGAGVQADLKTFAALGVYGVCAITAVTVQNTRGVASVAPLQADLVTAQIEALAGDITVHSTKIGMLATVAIVEAVAAAIAELDLPLVVLDPILVSTSGEPLLDADGVRLLVTELLPRSFVVTPNIPEAEALSGVPIRSPEDARTAARRLREMGAGAVVITGGHAVHRGEPGAPAEVVDLLYDGHTFTEYHTTRIDAGRLHGTGCAFSSALAAGVALGHPLGESVRLAQAYVAGAIAHAHAIGHGALVLEHSWNRVIG